MAGNLTVQGTQTGAPAYPNGRAIGPWTNAMGEVDEQLLVTLTEGDNIVTPPGPAIGCLIVPPIGGTETLKLKGATGSTGLDIDNVATFGPWYFGATGAPAFYINAVGATGATTPLEVTFF